MMNLLLALATVLVTNVVLATPNAFNIQLVFDGPISAQQKAAFESAKARWEGAITNDIGGKVTIPAGQRVCGQPPQPVDLVVDDILIFAKVGPIDGPGRVLGSAGPCGFSGQKVRLGAMQFDSADAQNLINDGTFAATVLHEMGHILGIGTVWDGRGLAGRNVIPGTTSFNYFGGNGVKGHQEIGGKGNAVVEGDGGQGTARGHWDEETYGDELMTGFLSGNVQPLSRLTLQALRDIGYNTNLDKADAFSINGGTAPPQNTKAPTLAKTKAPTLAGATNAPTLAATNAPTLAATKAPTLAATKAPTPPNANNGQGFQIQLVYTSPVTDSQKLAFEAAAAKWERVIIGDIGATVTVQKGQAVCGLAPQAQDLLIDDILVFVGVSNIDGPKQVLAQAGPCAFDQGNRARIGIITMDSSDIGDLEGQGTLVNTVTHEIGHILGIGPEWNKRGLAGKLLIPGTTSVRYFGPAGIQGHKEINGPGNNPVVEGDGGAGTARVHWDEETYGDELMTGFLSGKEQPMSVMTVRSLFDIGYNIDPTKADKFTAPAPGTARRRLRNLQTTNWETEWNGEIVWDLFPMNKSLEIDVNTWEIPFQGAVVNDLVEEGTADNTSAIVGGLFAAFAVVGAAAFVVIKRNKQALETTPRDSMTAARNPMFQNEPTVTFTNQYNGNNQYNSNQYNGNNQYNNNQY